VNPTDSTTRPKSRRRPWLIAACLAIAIGVTVSAVFVLSSTGGSKPSSVVTASQTEILPSSGTPSRCIIGVPGQPRPVLDLTYGVLQANTYDVPGGTQGQVGMCYSAPEGSMFGYANWTAVGGSGYSWMSYPQVTYGVNFWYGPYSTFTGQNPDWSLPRNVSSVVEDDAWFTTQYSIHPPPSRDVDGYDLSLDDFLTESWPSYFEVGPFVEVEMFLAHNISYPFEWIHWSTPTLVNGTIVSEPWDVAWWCHGPDNSSNANVSFDFSLGGQDTHGLTSGTVGVNVSAVLREVEQLMPSVGCWTGPTNGFSSFHLDEANLGSEDGAMAGSSFNYNWTIVRYCLTTNVGLPTATSVSCSSVSSSDTATPDATAPPPWTDMAAATVVRVRPS